MNVLAAGFGSLPESPSAWALIVGAFVATVLVSFWLRRPRSNPAGRVTSAAPYAIISLPLVLLVAAVLVQGPYWSDWHFWQLYLICATMSAGCYIITLLAWRFVSAIKDGRTIT